MTLIDVIIKLEKQGHSVAYTHRKDGGYVIRRIDGTTYKGKKGNQVARTIVGATLSEARTAQLKRINKYPSKAYHSKKEPLPPELLKEMRRIQRKWRKEHPTIAGTIGLKGLRYQYETFGLEKALASLDKANRYAEGYAYIENVQTLINRLEADNAKANSPEIAEIIEMIKEKTLTFKEDWINAIYDELYDWEKLKSSKVIAETAKEVARKIKLIIQ